MKTISEQIWQSAYTYSTYRELIDELLEKEQTTGTNHAPDMLQHTRMNVQRMKRLDKQASLDPAVEANLQQNHLAERWLVISEAWCGDAAQNLPWLVKAAEVARAELRILLRDEHLDVMDAFLTNGGRSIPKVIFLNAEMEVLGDWGPRPEAAQRLYLDLKTQGLPYLEASTQLHKWYADNKGADLQAELLALMASWQLV